MLIDLIFTQLSDYKNIFADSVDQNKENALFSEYTNTFTAVLSISLGFSLFYFHHVGQDP